MKSLTRQRVLILGSTGSIGKSTLDVILRNPDLFEVVGLVAHKSEDNLVQQIKQHSPKFVALTDASAHTSAKTRWPEISWHHSMEEICHWCACEEVDVVVAAIVGAAGLRPTMAAVKAGKKVLLANKESLVLTGALMMDAAEASGAQLLPVDSEHNAIFQSLPQNFQRKNPQLSGVEKIWLTASGGPFLNSDLASLAKVTPAQAINHPNWSMGRKISVDSATMANKGLELIEAFWLFGLGSSDIEVVIHPQSIVHSLVQYKDGSFLAQLGAPDMRTPIANCLSYPKRIESGAARLDLKQLKSLSFSAPDEDRFPALRLARVALEQGGAAPAVFNAANEIAVDAFLKEKIGFLDIARLIERTMETSLHNDASSIDAVLFADARTRDVAQNLCDRFSH
ncbi:MAG: 1-deoxy-D-xylulose-5-phosphate reductoisomerase [Burkholderiales bacterium]|nr:1-deoxy-D-xylulose-5-phosphate reductoisomerase [Burkholderiales bacterium]